MRGGGEEAIVFVAIYCVLILVGLLIQIFFLLTLMTALSRCSRENRTMEPSMVWLNLIPCFNLIWLFITVTRVSESLSNEFYERRYPRDGDFGKTLGITYLVLVLLSFIPLVGLGGLICFILYWVKIAGYNSQLNEPSRSRDRYDDDDRPRRRSRYDDDDRFDRDRDEDDRPRRRSDRSRRDDDDDY